jgi:hypothetical protein
MASYEPAGMDEDGTWNADLRRIKRRSEGEK